MQSNRRDLLIVLVLTVGTFFIYSHLLLSPRSPDEKGYLAWSMKIYKDGVYGTPDGRPVTRVPPLHAYLVAFGYLLLGPSTESAQCMSAIFGALTVGLLYLVGRILFGWRVGFLAALLLIASAKGEFWIYSNRVLSEVHLTFFILVTLFGLCLYWRYGRLWMAAVAGAGLGLGLLTKELTILTVPLFLIVFLLRKERFRKRILVLTAVMLLSGSILLPWVLHVKHHTGSLWGRGKRGQAVKVHLHKSAWGLRGGNDILETIHLRGMTPRWFRVIYVVSLFYAAYLFWRRRSVEGGLLMMFVLIWLSFLLMNTKVSLTHRRLIPLLPIYSLFVGILLNDLYERACGAGDFKRWVRYGMWTGLASLLWVSLEPQRLPASIRPLALLESPVPQRLRDKATLAMRCLRPGARVLTNSPNLFYFYTQGAYPVYKPGRMFKEMGSVGDVDTNAAGRKSGKASSKSEKKMNARSFASAIRRMEISHIIVFGPGRGQLQAMVDGLLAEKEIPGMTLCRIDRVRVYSLIAQ